MWLTRVLGINQDVIQIYLNKNIKLFSKNFVDVALKTGRRIKKTKKYDLILEVIVSGIKSHLLLVTFSDSHLIIGIGEI